MFESWTVLSRSSNDVTIRRDVSGRVTVWNLSKTVKGWKVFSIQFSNGSPQGPCKKGLGQCWDNSLHKNGIRLTVNRVDTILREYCEGVRV